jgi:hypothetical protein
VATVTVRVPESLLKRAQATTGRRNAEAAVRRALEIATYDYELNAAARRALVSNAISAAPQNQSINRKRLPPLRRKQEKSRWSTVRIARKPDSSASHTSAASAKSTFRSEYLRIVAARSG